MNYTSLSHSCSFCVTNQEDQLNIFSDEEIDKLIRAIFFGLVSVDNLSVDYYVKVGRKLTEAVFEGFGRNLINIQFGDPDFEMLTRLREDVFIFSGAKDYQQTREMSSFLTKGDEVVSFAEFNILARGTFDNYNRNWLTAEYNSAIAQAQSARQWTDIQRDKDFFPQLQYETVGDGRVRPEHAALDNIVRPVNDKFWDTFMPPNGWNCRCTVLQVDGEKNSDLSKHTPPTEKEVPAVFRFNAGKTKQIFSPAHPYYDVARGDEQFKRNNFGLPKM